MPSVPVVTVGAHTARASKSDRTSIGAAPGSTDDADESSAPAMPESGIDAGTAACSPSRPPAAAVVAVASLEIDGACGQRVGVDEHDASPSVGSGELGRQRAVEGVEGITELVTAEREHRFVDDDHGEITAGDGRP